MMEQLPPIKNFGKTFVLRGPDVPPGWRYTVHIAKPHSKTEIELSDNGNHYEVIEARSDREVVRIDANETMVLNTNKPVLVMMGSLEDSIEGDVSTDPTFVVAQPESLWTTHVRISRFSSLANDLKYQAILVTSANCTQEFEINENPTEILWNSTGDYKSGIMRLPDDNAMVTIHNSLCPFGGYVFSCDEKASWSYPFEWKSAVTYDGETGPDLRPKSDSGSQESPSNSTMINLTPESSLVSTMRTMSALWSMKTKIQSSDMTNIETSVMPSPGQSDSGGIQSTSPPSSSANTMTGVSLETSAVGGSQSQTGSTDIPTTPGSQTIANQISPPTFQIIEDPATSTMASPSSSMSPPSSSMSLPSSSMSLPLPPSSMSPPSTPMAFPSSPMSSPSSSMSLPSSSMSLPLLPSSMSPPSTLMASPSSSISPPSSSMSLPPSSRSPPSSSMSPPSSSMSLSPPSSSMSLPPSSMSPPSSSMSPPSSSMSLRLSSMSLPPSSMSPPSSSMSLRLSSTSLAPPSRSPPSSSMSMSSSSSSMPLPSQMTTAALSTVAAPDTTINESPTTAAMTQSYPSQTLLSLVPTSHADVSTQAFFTQQPQTSSTTNVPTKSTKKTPISNFHNLVLCPCECTGDVEWIANITMEEQEEQTKAIVRTLRVEKSKLSKSKSVRQKISAQDKRASSTYLGSFFTGLLLVSLLSIVIIPDLRHALYYTSEVIKQAK